MNEKIIFAIITMLIGFLMLNSYVSAENSISTSTGTYYPSQLLPTKNIFNQKDATKFPARLDTTYTNTKDIDRINVTFLPAFVNDSTYTEEDKIHLSNNMNIIFYDVDNHRVDRPLSGVSYRYVGTDKSFYQYTIYDDGSCNFRCLNNSYDYSPHFVYKASKVYHNNDPKFYISQEPQVIYDEDYKFPPNGNSIYNLDK